MELLQEQQKQHKNQQKNATIIANYMPDHLAAHSLRMRRLKEIKDVIGYKVQQKVDSSVFEGGVGFNALFAPAAYLIYRILQCSLQKRKTRCKNQIPCMIICKIMHKFLIFVPLQQ